MVQMNWFTGQKLRHRCREQTYGHQGGKVAGGGGGVMNCEIAIDICTLICIKWITDRNLLYKKINKIQKFKKNQKTEPEVSRRKEIIKIREEINKIEIKKTIEKKNQENQELVL